MFPYQIVRNPLSFSKIIGGLSKGLSIANQVIPLYQQAKPLIKNAQSAFSILKNLNLRSISQTLTSNNNQVTNTTPKTTPTPQPSTTSKPSFFI